MMKAPKGGYLSKSRQAHLLLAFFFPFLVSLVLPLSHFGLFIELSGSKETIFHYARLVGGAYSSLTATGGGLPKFNY